MDKKTKVIPIFIPHEGCPHDCVFCNQKKISGSIKSPSAHEIVDIIESSFMTIDSQKNNIIIAFYGGSFTAISKLKQIEYLKIAKFYKDSGKVQLIRISTRPDYMNIENVKLLKEYGVDHVELGIQSTDQEVLLATRRYYDLNTITSAVDNLKAYQIDFGFQIMLNLPGDNLYKLVKTCFDLSPMKPSTIRIYPTLVIEGTELADMYKDGIYIPLTLDEAIELSIIPMIIFESIGSTIIRVGLHASESLLLPNSILAGPFHSAFGEMVQSRIYRIMIGECIEENKLNRKTIYILANERIFSKISGNRQENRIYFKEQYEVNYKFQSDNSLNHDILLRWEEKDYYISKKEFYCRQLDYYKQITENPNGLRM